MEKCTTFRHPGVSASNAAFSFESASSLACRSAGTAYHTLMDALSEELDFGRLDG